MGGRLFILTVAIVISIAGTDVPIAITVACTR